ncbi:hypothetical protein Taro_002697 [Colocasia esculenta]|uniref:Uncharacterized protein n=1 Tax=Colocasia esculenta TaxID=4460 RepID=A0A843TLP9_COLES|nr:hypothetical protein [Colocasia esculenta]
MVDLPFNDYMPSFGYPEGVTVEVQGHQLLARLYALQLRDFDVILGMDWLEAHSAMGTIEHGYVLTVQKSDISNPTVMCCSSSGNTSSRRIRPSEVQLFTISELGDQHSNNKGSKMGMIAFSSCTHRRINRNSGSSSNCPGAAVAEECKNKNRRVQGHDLEKFSGVALSGCARPKVIPRSTQVADSGNQTTQVDALSGQVDTRACSQNSSFQNWGQQVDATPEQVDTGSCSQNSCFQNRDSRLTQHQSRSTLDQFPEQPVSRFGTVCRHHH